MHQYVKHTLTKLLKKYILKYFSLKHSLIILLCIVSYNFEFKKSDVLKIQEEKEFNN